MVPANLTRAKSRDSRGFPRLAEEERQLLTAAGYTLARNAHGDEIAREPNALHLWHHAQFVLDRYLGAGNRPFSVRREKLGAWARSPKLRMRSIS